MEPGTLPLNGMGMPSFNQFAVRRQLFLQRYARQHNIEDLVSALRLTLSVDPQYRLLLRVLADDLLRHFTATNTYSFLERTIKCHEDLVELVDEEEDQFKEHKLLGNLLFDASSFDPSIEILDKAEKHALAAYNALQKDGKEDFTINTNLGDILLRRFNLARNLNDLKIALVFRNKAIEKTKPEESAYFSQKNDKFCVLSRWAEHTGDAEILRQAFELGESLVEYTAGTGNIHDYIVAAIHFGDISLKLPRTDERLTHHSKAAEHLAKVESKVQPDAAHQDLALATHAQLLLELFRVTRDDSQLKESKDKIDEALRKVPPNSGQRAKYMLQRGLILTDEARMTRLFSSWELVVKQGEEALTLPQSNLLDTSDLHYSLCVAYMELFRLKPDVNHIQLVIEHGLESLKCLSQGNNQQHKARAYELLSKAYYTRFETERGSTDIEESIKFGKLATADDLNPEQVTYLVQLATVLRGKNSITNDKDYIESALLYARRACELEKVRGRATPETYGTLSLVLLDVMRLNTRIDEFDEALQTAEQWLSLSNSSDRNQWLGLFHLGRLHYHSYCQNHLQSGLETAISKVKEALDCLPVDHPNQAEILDLLGDWIRESVTDSKETQAREIYSRAAKLEGASPARRIRAGRLAAHFHIKNKEWALAFGYLKDAVGLFPRVSPRVFPRDDQQKIVYSLSGTAGLAAACALNAGLKPNEALSVLEAGRGIISGWQIQSRSDISALVDGHPDLAAKYEGLRSRISGASTISSDVHEHDTETDLHVGSSIPFDLTSQSRAEDRRNDNLELEALEMEIRSKEGFENFQQPLSPKDCMSLAEIAPVIVLNLSPHGSHALVVTKAGIEALEIPSLSDNTFSTELASLFYNDPVMKGGIMTLGKRNKRLRRFLEYLWDNVGERILKYLGFLQPPNPQQRIIWVTNGPASLLPMHAAGYYEDDNQKNMSAHVTSSYITSFRALKYTRERRELPILTPTSAPLLLGMPKTIGQSDLSAEAEAEALKAVFTTTKFKIPDNIFSPSKQQALDHITSPQIIHFACHGSSDPNDPSKSHLLLHDTSVPGIPDRLSVADIVSANTNNKSSLARLAYLSACSTAKHALPDFFDENIHLAATFQLIGFSHVIGTLWAVGDLVSVGVARDFYKELLGRCRDEVVPDEAIPFALHEAVRLLRETKEPGSRVRPAEAVLSWVPYVHFGG